MAGDVAVSVLGPLEVRTGGRAIPVAGVKLQSLLGLLALAVPHTVSDDRLFDELWGDEPPSKPANALQALVSHLRRVLGREILVRHGNGYALRIDPASVDALRLDELVREGRGEAGSGHHDRAGSCFRTAIGLVRGTPFAGLADQWFAREAVARLDELVLSAQEGLVDSELALGHHADAIPLLTDLVVRQPMRERFRGQLIVALYRCGRQVEALQAYRSARRYLADELGLEPGPELRQLERSVLAHDPALAAPIPVTSAVAGRPELPAPLTSFVGRAGEVAALEQVVGASRLVSLVGPGGVGKTRLAVELAQWLSDRHEIWFIELAPVAPASGHVADAIATGVGAPDRDGVSTPPLQRAVERLAERPALLVLDNCEHVLADVATATAGLLAGCPGLRVITTSREPIALDGERQVPVQPLAVDDAVALFVARARDAQPLFDGLQEVGQLTSLVEHLDGLPLAIELAAARSKSLPVPEMVERLADRFQLLRRTSHRGPARHDGLEAAIEWSYDLLFSDEQDAFQRLAVYPGGATVETVERVCGPDGLDLAGRLVDRSLLVADTSGAAVRFTMLESLRAFGCARLQAAGRLDDVRDQQVAWCCELAERVEIACRTRDQVTWLDRLDDEHDNIRSALHHAVGHDPAAALRLAGALIRPWWFRGRRQEIREWATAVLDVAGTGWPLLRAKVLATVALMAEPRHHGAGSASVELRDELIVAERHHREAIAIYREFGAPPRDLASAELLLLATMSRRATMGETVQPGEAAALVASAAAVFDSSGDDYGSVVVRTTDAILAIAEGDLARAAALVEVVAPIARRLGERYSSGRLAYVQGMLDDLAGNPRSAYRHHEQALRLNSELGLHQAVTAEARLLAPLADRCGEPGLAAQWRAFVDDRDSVWTPYDGTVVALARNRAGVQARHGGDLAEAEAAHRAALEWYLSAELTAGIAASETGLGLVADATGDVTGSALHRATALAVAQIDDDPVALAGALVGAAHAVVGDDPERALRLLGAADELRGTSKYAPDGIEDDVAELRATIRRSLGDARFEAVLEAGRRLDRRAAIVLAGP